MSSRGEVPWSQVETLPVSVDATPVWAPPVLEPPDKNAHVAACPAGEHRAGIVPNLGHLVYRPHAVRTITGGGFLCSASLRPVCVCPPPSRPDIRCWCQTETVATEGNS